jgi:hypothetical protein
MPQSRRLAAAFASCYFEREDAQTLLSSFEDRAIVSRDNEASGINVRIESGDYCFFVDGAWNCAGESCSNPNHHVG